MLFDSDVIIWGLRGLKHAQSMIDAAANRFISAVTYMEICRGLKNKEESLSWKSFLSEISIKVIPVDESISNKAMYLIEEFSLSHGLTIPDAFIAATANTHGLILITGNIKDYKFLPGLSIKSFKE